MRRPTKRSKLLYDPASFNALRDIDANRLTLIGAIAIAWNEAESWTDSAMSEVLSLPGEMRDLKVDCVYG